MRRFPSVVLATLLVAFGGSSSAEAAVRRTTQRPAASSVAKPIAKPMSRATSPAPSNPYRRSPYVGALAIDAQTGRILFSDRSEQAAYPASVTKLMTAYLVLDEVKAGRLKLSDPVTASVPASSTDRWLRQPSCTGITPGSQMTVDELLSALMVRSANDAAIFLAEKCCGSWSAFVVRMNAKAKELGMSQTTYYNPNGLPPPVGAKERKFNTSTCADQAKLARALLRDHPGILTYTSRKTWKPTCLGNPMTAMVTDPKTKAKKTVEVGVWVNHNNVMVKDKLKVHNPDGSEASDGLKTGYIDAGGSSVVLTGKRTVVIQGKPCERRAIVVVLGSQTAAERDETARHLLSDALDAITL